VVVLGLSEKHAIFCCGNIHWIYVYNVFLLLNRNKILPCWEMFSRTCYENVEISYYQKQVFSAGTLVSSTNKIDHHDILVTEILLKMALNTITLIP
jgi:hypothetical protein